MRTIKLACFPPCMWKSNTIHSVNNGSHSHSTVFIRIWCVWLKSTSCKVKLLINLPNTNRHRACKYTHIFQSSINVKKPSRSKVEPHVAWTGRSQFFTSVYQRDVTRSRGQQPDAAAIQEEHAHSLHSSQVSSASLWYIFPSNLYPTP